MGIDKSMFGIKFLLQKTWLFGTALFPGEDRVPAAKHTSLTFCTP